MGVVYRARDLTLDDIVALKVLRGEMLKDDPTHLERFKQEIKLARRITHRNVLRTHDFGEAAGTPYISMEYLEGVTLKDLIRNKGALPVPVGLRIAKQMCQGLEAAHLQGVVHRDIKPQNMLILPETGDLKIMDFGIARVQAVKAGEAGLTTAGTVMGTPDYMSPEQAQGLPADFRSDIYSLGIVLFEVFTGALPFTGRHDDGNRAQPHPEPAARAALGQPAGARAAGGDHPEGHRQGSRPPLPDRGRPARRPGRGVGYRGGAGDGSVASPASNAGCSSSAESTDFRKLFPASLVLEASPREISPTDCRPTTRARRTTVRVGLDWNAIASAPEGFRSAAVCTPELEPAL